MFTKWHGLAPTIRESVACRKDNGKEAKEHDEYTVGTNYLEADNKLVGYVPTELSFLIFTFLKACRENKDWKTDLLSLYSSWPK